MEIKGFIETSLIDWDGKLSSVIFLPGCNFRCPFCHNHQLVYTPEELENIELDKIRENLVRRKGWIDGVVITGGEPLIHPDLTELILKIRSLDLPVKLDTNGSHPQDLLKLIEGGYIDYVAMDIKAPLDERYSQVVGVKATLPLLLQTIEILMTQGIDYEFRTTLVPTIVGLSEIVEIAKTIKGAKRFVLQKFVPENAYSAEFRRLKSFPSSMVDKMLEGIAPYVRECKYRGK